MFVFLRPLISSYLFQSCMNFIFMHILVRIIFKTHVPFRTTLDVLVSFIISLMCALISLYSIWVIYRHFVSFWYVCVSRLNSNNIGNWYVQVMDFLTRLVDWKRLTLNDEPCVYKDKIWVGPTSTVR